MDEILILAPGLLGALVDRNVVLGSKLKESCSAFQGLEELGLPPRGEDLQGGVKSLPGELESDLARKLLVIPFYPLEITILTHSTKSVSKRVTSAGEKRTYALASLLQSKSVYVSSDSSGSSVSDLRIRG